MRYLWRLAAPQANPFVEHGQRSKHAREQVQLAGADQSAYGSEDQKEKRRAKEALGWERGQFGGKWNGGHNAKVYVSTRWGEQQEGKSAAVQKITRHARAESAEGDASAARAALGVRLEMAREEGEIISASEIVLAFGMRGSCPTVTRKGRRVMAR